MRPDNQPTITEATTAGSAAGGPKGYNDGYAHGKQTAYNTSYTSAYNTAYNTNLSNINCIDEGRGILPMIATDGSRTLVGGNAGRLDGYIYGAKLGCGVSAGTSPCPQ